VKNLLNRGHRVYIKSDNRVIHQIRDDLYHRYGERVRFVDGKNSIKEKFYEVDL